MHHITGFNTLNYQELIESERRIFEMRMELKERNIRKRLKKPHLWKGLPR